MRKSDERCLDNMLIEGMDIHEFLKLNSENFIKNNGIDELIKIAIVNQLNVDQTQELLIISEKGKLYPRFKRDAIIIHAISNKKSLEELNNDLGNCSEAKL